MKILDFKEDSLISVIEQTFPNDGKLATHSLQKQMENVQEFLHKTNEVLNTINNMDESDRQNLGLTLIGMSISNILINLTPVDISDANDFFKKICNKHTGLFSGEAVHPYGPSSKAVN